MMYDRLQGVLPEAIGEGTHLRIPWVQMPTIMDIRTRPRSISSVTGTKGARYQPLVHCPFALLPSRPLHYCCDHLVSQRLQAVLMCLRCLML